MVLQAFSAGGAPPLVLLAEHDRDGRKVYALALERAGVQVIQADNGRLALAKAITLAPDLIVTDLLLRGLDGIELCERVKESARTREIPVIILSDVADLGGGARAQSVGADAVLPRSCAPEALLAEVRRLLPTGLKARTASERLRRPAVVLRVKSARLPTTSRRLQARLDPGPFNRKCPDCGDLLEWNTTRTVSDRDYDHYEWCDNGCGLFYYDRQARKMIKLTD